MRLPTAFETVGAERSVWRTRSARESGPRAWISRNTRRSLSLPTTLGRKFGSPVMVVN